MSGRPWEHRAMPFAIAGVTLATLAEIAHILLTGAA